MGSSLPCIKEHASREDKKDPNMMSCQWRISYFPRAALNNLNQDFVNNNNGGKTAKNSATNGEELSSITTPKGPSGHLWWYPSGSRRVSPINGSYCGKWARLPPKKEYTFLPLKNNMKYHSTAKLEGRKEAISLDFATAEGTRHVLWVIEGGRPDQSLLGPTDCFGLQTQTQRTAVRHSRTTSMWLPVCGPKVAENLHRSRVQVPSSSSAMSGNASSSTYVQPVHPYIHTSTHPYIYVVKCLLPSMYKLASHKLLSRYL